MVEARFESDLNMSSTEDIFNSNENLQWWGQTSIFKKGYIKNIL